MRKHTDHNGGLVIGCAVDVDLILVASPIAERKINIMSEGFGFVSFDIDEAMKMPPEKFTTAALAARRLRWVYGPRMQRRRL